jgi:hypothetical protein
MRAACYLRTSAGSPTQFLYRDELANGAPSLTFGVEAASSRLLWLLNKRLDAGVIHDRLSSLVKGGLRNVEFYFLSGIPTETRSDRLAVAALIDFAVNLLDEVEGEVIVNVNPLIPTPQTAMQRVRACSGSELDEWLQHVRSEVLRKIGHRRFSERLRLSSMPVEDHLLQTLTIRSDRRIGRVLEMLYDTNGRLSLNEDLAERLLEQAGLPDLGFYRRRIAHREIVPWQLVESPTVRAAEATYLKRERKVMEALSTTL